MIHDDEKYVWDMLRPIIPYPTGRFFRGTLSQALRARLRSVLSLRDTLADVSQQHLEVSVRFAVNLKKRAFLDADILILFRQTWFRK